MSYIIAATVQMYNNNCIIQGYFDAKGEKSQKKENQPILLVNNNKGLEGNLNE